MLSIILLFFLVVDGHWRSPRFLVGSPLSRWHRPDPLSLVPVVLALFSFLTGAVRSPGLTIMKGPQVSFVSFCTYQVYYEIWLSARASSPFCQFAAPRSIPFCFGSHQNTF